jgi:hypothetical protein
VRDRGKEGVGNFNNKTSKLIGSGPGQKGKGNLTGGKENRETPPTPKMNLAATLNATTAGCLKVSPVDSKPVVLKKEGGEGKKTPPSTPKSAEEWVKAKEFVPGQFYSGAGRSNRSSMFILFCIINHPVGFFLRQQFIQIIDN